MKGSKFFLFRLATCTCLLLAIQVNQIPASMAKPDQPVMMHPTPPLGTTDTFEVAPGVNPQRRPDGQVGMRCVIYPRCPDCDEKGNVCRRVEQFFPGVTVLAKGKSLMVTLCRRAHALDYCGGSRACMRKTRQEQQSHRQKYGGGCYAQCQEKNVVCVLESR
jgi:hypothetical protein